MRNTVIWSFLSLMALATGGLMTGCDSDAKLAKSSAGESCDNTSDCNDGLKCLDGTCYKTGTSAGGSANNEGGDGTGATVTGPPAPVLGGPGESCTKRADCEDGLGCFSQRCQQDVSGAGGEGNGGPILGGPGETCGLTTDCADGLQCLPTDGYIDFAQAKAIGSNSVGVCSQVNSGLVATGKGCFAECLEAADCCELPVEMHAILAANSCTELAGLIDGVNCATAVAGTLNAERCFAQTAFCECGKNTWACVEGTCSYTAACSKAAFNAPGGCPTYTRSGNYLGAMPCDTTGSKKCAPAEAPANCTTDAQCDDKIVADSPALAPETCAAGECTCYKETGACYRKCGEDLDCPAHFSCDPKTTVCVQEPACTTDAQCVTLNNDIRFKCFDGTCDFECDNDRDCNYGSLTYGPDTRVCNAQRRCEAVGCAADAECPPRAGNGVRMFCADNLAAAALTGIHSAITD